MADKVEVASSFKDFREFIQDFQAPELREIKVTQKAQEAALAELRADMKAGFAEIKADMRAGFAEIKTDMKTGFDRFERRVETYDDVQKLKEEMAEVRGERRARQKESAA